MSLIQRLEANDKEFDEPDPPKIQTNKMKNAATTADIRENKGKEDLHGYLEHPKSKKIFEKVVGKGSKPRISPLAQGYVKKEKYEVLLKKVENYEKSFKKIGRQWNELRALVDFAEEKVGTVQKDFLELSEPQDDIKVCITYTKKDKKDFIIEATQTERLKNEKAP